MVEAGLLLVVAAVITDDDGCVLACRRAPGRAAAGRWEFPGGKVDPGETPQAALVREIAEELAVPISVGDHLTTDDTVVAGQVIRLRCYRSMLTGEAPLTSTDHDELRWVAPEDLQTLTWADPDLPAVAVLAPGR